MSFLADDTWLCVCALKDYDNLTHIGPYIEVVNSFAKTLLLEELSYFTNTLPAVYHLI